MASSLSTPLNNSSGLHAEYGPRTLAYASVNLIGILLLDRLMLFKLLKKIQI
tara:strand:+ start:329 stop:484 length:156 start_codon:yes stop_codon:yes gene_type:complete